VGLYTELYMSTLLPHFMLICYPTSPFRFVLFFFSSLVITIDHIVILCSGKIWWWV